MAHVWQSDDVRVGCFDLVEKRLDVARRDEAERDASTTSYREHQEHIESHGERFRHEASRWLGGTPISRRR